MIALCACGCGATLITRDSQNRPRRFIRGHWTRTSEGQRVLAEATRPSQKGQWRKDSAHWRTSRYRARTTIDTLACAWSHIGGCKGRVDAAHVDGDFTNNSDGNKLPLCKSHHRLLDNGKIDPMCPTMPVFRTGPDGKRRYSLVKA